MRARPRRPLNMLPALAVSGVRSACLSALTSAVAAPVATHWRSLSSARSSDFLSRGYGSSVFSKNCGGGGGGGGA
ncbi:hypothetical protein BDY21DRAFT_330062 [Lineolata rhizophorae]|uniref:Secreted protein n=1 Tax=Lineolata rhizophorae TaxID=578093 RepID=A0A6A6PDB1_9PEZI|nr:hypothetical protein BDY21DRAFT_330062 [Lineolata rhizophorae]